MNKRRVWALVLSIVMVLSVFAYAPVQNLEASGVSVQYKSNVQTFIDQNNVGEYLQAQEATE